MDCHGLWVWGVFGILNTGLHDPTLCQPSTWDGREWWGVTVCRLHVHVYMGVLTKATKKQTNKQNVFVHQHWPWTLSGGGFLLPLSLPNETQSSLPGRKGGKKKKEKKEKSQTNNSECSTSGDDQHTARDREVAFPWWQLPGWLRWLQHTLFCKRHSHIACL